MAIATATALMIGAAAAGGMFAGKRAARRQQQQQQAPVTAPGPGTGDVPAAPIVNQGADMATAVGAGQRQRKRAALGGLSARPLPKPGNVSSSARPRTLIGY